VALDASRARLQQARRRVARRCQVRFVEADLLDLHPGHARCGRAPVDAVFSTATFHWVTDRDRLFADLAAVLRPGGPLVAQRGGQGNIARLLATVRSLAVERAGTWNYASSDATARRLAAAGSSTCRSGLTASRPPSRRENSYSMSSRPCACATISPPCPRTAAGRSSKPGPPPCPTGDRLRATQHPRAQRRGPAGATRQHSRLPRRSGCSTPGTPSTRTRCWRGTWIAM
jgi:hypothetical protein